MSQGDMWWLKRYVVTQGEKLLLRGRCGGSGGEVVTQGDEVAQSEM